MNLQRGPTAAATDPVHVLHRDYETRSLLRLEQVGVWKYANDPATEVLCCAFAADNEPVKIWKPGDPVPVEFLAAAQSPQQWLAVAHNAAFELAVEHSIMVPRYGWPKIPFSRQRCTMATALALALPPKLEAVAAALELVHQKDRAGARLMQMMARPRRPHKDEEPAGTYWFDDADRLARLYEYCIQDVEVERELFGQLRPLPRGEQALWQLDFRINARGFAVDRELATAARRIAQAAAPEINTKLAELTSGAVTTISQVARLKAWLITLGCDCTELDKKAIAKLLMNEELPAKVRRVLELRQAGAQAAAKKIDALLNRCDGSGRIRFSLRYHGASTGRWSGTGLQVQNLKRPELEDIDAAVAAVATGDYDHVRSLYPKPLAVIGNISRSLICAAHGHQLIGGDFSSIESRVLAWIGDEEWKLDSYRRFDATLDPHDEPYLATACKIYGVPDGSFDGSSPERKVGKTCDLAFGYAGGLRAFRVFMPDRFTDAEVETFKQEWRSAHPRIRRFWREIDIAAWRAVREREQIIRCGRLLLKCTGSFLFIKLPGGRKLSYPFPRIEVEDLEHEVVVYKDASSGQWRDVRNGDGAYGGLWTENVVSAISRDLLAAALIRLEAAGYRIVLHVHDEVVAEVPIGFGSTEEFTRIMTVTPDWALGLPIAAKAWSGPHFCK